MGHMLGGRCCLPGRALLVRGGVWSLSPPGSQAWLRSRLLCSLESLLDLAYSLRQKISFFRKLLGDFLFGNYLSQWCGGGVILQLTGWWWWFSQSFHSGWKILRKTKPTRIPCTSWADSSGSAGFCISPGPQGARPTATGVSVLSISSCWNT